MCVLTNKIYIKHFKRDVHSFALVMPKEWEIGALGCTGRKKKFKHRDGANQIDGDNEHNRMQLKFSTCGQTGDLWVM